MVWNVKRAAANLLALALLTAAGTVSAQDLQQVVAGVGFTAVDQRVLDAVEGLGVSVVRRTVGEVADTSAITFVADAWPEQRTLVVDSEHQTLQVLRRADHTALVRVFAPGTFETSEYAAALAAVELLGLSRETPVAAVAPPRKPPAPKKRADLRWVLAAGAEIAASLGRDPTLWRPTLALGADFGLRAESSTFLLAQLVTAPFARLSRAVPKSTTGQTVEYRRSDVGGRLGAGARMRAGGALGYLSGGVGLLSARVRARGTGVQGEDRRARPFFGVGGALRHDLSPSLALAFGLELVWMPGRLTYLVEGRTAIREGALRIGSSLALIWSLH